MKFLNDQKLQIILMGLAAQACVGCGPAHPMASSTSSTINSDSTSMLDSKDGSLATPIPAWAEPAQHFDLKVVSGVRQTEPGSSLNIPDLTRLRSQNSHVAPPFAALLRTNANQITINNVIQIFSPLSSPLLETYFVWTDQCLGASFSQITSTHQILSGSNQFVSDPTPVPVFQDPTDRVWFVKISTLFREHPYYQDHPVTQADTQILTQWLVLSNGQRVSVEIQFRARMI